MPQRLFATLGVASSQLMIVCKPKGLCSWNFLLEGEGVRADLELNWMSEQGKIVVGGISLEVCKHGLLSGRWTLEHEGIPIATAQKSLTRKFQITTSDGDYLLRAQSLTRSFVLEQDNATVARIAPKHPFTRRATIEGPSSEVNITTIVFSFWLVVLTWRRAANNS